VARNNLQISILGSTGSVGCSTLAVIDENPQYSVFALTAHKNARLLFEQCQKYTPVFAVIGVDAAAEFEVLVKESGSCDQTAGGEICAS